MNCKSVESRLSAYLDGELTGQEMFCLRDHLNRCCQCREEAESLKGLKQLIGSIECPEPPRDFEARLTAAVLSSRKPKPTIQSYGSAILFFGVAGVTMLATLQLLSAMAPHPAAAKSSVPISSKPDVDFEVNRDVMTSSISDPISGAPVWSAVDNH